MKVRLKIELDGSDEDRYYERDVEMPFLPFVGLEMEFCECCSGLKIKDMTWNQASGTLIATMEFSTISHPAVHFHDTYIHWGFTEDENLRGCCR
jgi:hypothetical protein